MSTRVFRVGLRGDDLDLFVEAESPDQAYEKAEELVGPLPPQTRYCTETAADAVPDGVELIR